VVCLAQFGLHSLVQSSGEPAAYPEFAADGHTAWRLFNAFSETWKGSNLAALPKRCEALHGLLDLACGLAV
jgi:hypothetical protein